MPLNIKKAYENGTRNYDGTPGPNYWQNSSEYKIIVEVIPEKKMLCGSESITYHNNSPDTLTFLVIRLYQDIFKFGNARDYSVSKETINDGVKISKTLVRGREVGLESNIKRDKNGTNLLLTLDEPVLPFTEINLGFEWNFIIPHKTTIRMGAYDSTSFFIGYWFPQVAVYDDIDGWDTNNYSGQVEFYNDFSNYWVEIKVPNNFAVWATGILQNPDELLTPKYLERFNLAQSSKEVIRIVTKDDLLECGIYNNSNSFNVWKYKAEDVTDFAFALSDHYLWDGLTTIVDSITKRTVFIQAAYKQGSKDFHDVALISKETIKFFSYELPAWPFPFPSLTIFNGSGGMEYPMMINNGSECCWSGTVGLTSHEISHSYFPFFMGINEQKYAFMDEGWAVMLPYDFQERMAEKNDPRSKQIHRYLEYAGTERDMPLIMPSVYLKGKAYRTSAYTKPAAAYDILRKMLGDDLFIEALNTFIEKWNGKHPIPYDFFYTFNNITGNSLNWYWKPWFFDFGYPDLSIENAAMEGIRLNVTVRKDGIIPVPVKLTFIYSDGTRSEVNKNASVWADGNDQIKISVETEGTIEMIKLGDSQIPDVNDALNTYILEN
jgi:hypothetical protein